MENMKILTIYECNLHLSTFIYFCRNIRDVAMDDTMKLYHGKRQLHSINMRFVSVE